MHSRARTALILLATLLPAAETEPRWMTLNHAARQAIQARDYATLRATLTELRPLLPGNPRILYNLAAAEARLGHLDAALVHLNNLAAAGLIYDFQSDDDFKPLAGDPRFASILRQVEQNRAPTARAAPFSTIPERDLLPEDLAYDAKTHRFFIASVTQCKIVTQDGKLFAKTDWPVMALRVDLKRRILWAASGYIPNCKSCDPAGKDKSALLAYNLYSGALIKRIESPVKGLLGDMTIGRAGDLYVSESIYGAVLHLALNSAVLDRLDTPGEFPSPQTPALSLDERTLFVPDYVRGIAALNLKTREIHWLQPAPGIVVSGVDGFYRYRDSFLAVQNGVAPARLLLLSADLKKQQILEANSPGLGEPTHGTFIGDAFYFIANTGWDDYGDDGKKKPDSAPVESQIRKITLRM